MKPPHSPAFRRTIKIVNHIHNGFGCARVALEDDYHHFRVQVEYANGFVTEVTGEAFRTPYTLCGQAVAVLPTLRGMPLSLNPTAITRYGDQRQHCTHMLDEAGLAITAAAGKIQQRLYEIEVPRHINGVTRPRLWRDQVLLLEWTVESNVIQSPATFAGVSIGRGMSRWTQNNLDSEAAEAALLLRRCAMISLGRLHNLDLEKHASSSGHCFVQQPDRAARALRIKGSTLDFSSNPADLIATDQTWLAQPPKEK